MTPSIGLDLPGPEARYDKKSKTGLWVSQWLGAHGETGFLEVFPRPCRLCSCPGLPAGPGPQCWPEDQREQVCLGPLGTFLHRSTLTVVSRVPVGVEEGTLAKATSETLFPTTDRAGRSENIPFLRHRSLASLNHPATSFLCVSYTLWLREGMGSACVVVACFKCLSMSFSFVSCTLGG